MKNFKLETLTVILLLTLRTPWISCETVVEATTSIPPLEFTIIHDDTETQTESYEVLDDTESQTETSEILTTDPSQTHNVTTEESAVATSEFTETLEELTTDLSEAQDVTTEESVSTTSDSLEAIDEYGVTGDEFAYTTDSTKIEDEITLQSETDNTTPSDEDIPTTYQPLLTEDSLSMDNQSLLIEEKSSVFKDVRIEDNLVDVDTTPDDLDHLLDADAEKEDEKDDLKIFESVLNSMAEYNLRKLEKKRHNGRVKRDEEIVCYKDLGCFKDEGPFNLMDMLPSTPEEVNTLFLLYTRENKEREQYLMYQNASSILNSNFDPARPTKVIVHGFGSSCFRIWVREMKQTFLHRMDVNVICVNWENGASTPNYVRAASNSRLVGAQLAVLLGSIQRYMNTSLDDLHLVGFSLGAHVAGFAGQRLQNVARISGLDPAGPLFEEYPVNMRLDASDARFVDVIHTNADSLLRGGLGAFQPMGHVDFYPNGGRMQKGCDNLFVGGVSDILWPTEEYPDGRYLCNHRRGYKYFTASVTPQCIFPSFVCRDYETYLEGDCFPCKNCGKMGYFAEEAVGRGKLYLVTSEMEPYCANQYKVSVFHSGGPPAEEFTTYGSVDVTFVAQNGLNQTLPLTRSEDQEMVAGGSTVRIMVPHPAFTDIQAIQLRYTAYQGWIYSGYKSWAINKISVMDSFGKTVTFCNLGTTLVSGKKMQFELLPGDCSPKDEQPVTFVKPWQVQDSVIEINTNNASTEGDAPGKIPLQQLPLPHSDPHHKKSQDNSSAPNIALSTSSNLNLIAPSDKPIPKPILTPMDLHRGVLAGPGDSQHPLLAITLEVPPKVHTNVQILTSHSSSHFDIIGVTEHPTLSVDVNGHYVNDVAASSEEPVNIIPAPNLALRHDNDTLLGSEVVRLSNGKFPQKNNQNYVDIYREESTTSKVFTIFNVTSTSNTNFNHIQNGYTSTTNSISDSTIMNGSTQFLTHPGLPFLTAIASDRVDDEEGIYINTPDYKYAKNETLEPILPQHQPQELLNLSSKDEKVEALIPQHHPQELIDSSVERLKNILPQHHQHKALESILPQHQPQEFSNLQSEGSEATLPQHQPQQHTIPEKRDKTNLEVEPFNNTLPVIVESELPGEFVAYYTGDTFSDLSTGDYYVKPLNVIGEVPHWERARTLKGDSININGFAPQTIDKDKTKQKKFSINVTNSTVNKDNSTHPISKFAEIRISSFANSNRTAPFLNDVIYNPPYLNPPLTYSRPALHLLPPIQEQLILRPDAMRPIYTRPIHQSSQLGPPPSPHTPILETIIGRGRAPRPYSFKKQSNTHEHQQSKLIEQNENNENLGKETQSLPQPVYVQILPSSFRNIRHLETSFFPPRDGRALHGRSGRGQSYVSPILVPQGENTHPVYIQLQNNRQSRYIPLRHSPIVST